MHLDCDRHFAHRSATCPLGHGADEVGLEQSPTNNQCNRIDHMWSSASTSSSGRTLFLLQRYPKANNQCAYAVAWVVTGAVCNGAPRATTVGDVDNKTFSRRPLLPREQAA